MERLNDQLLGAGQFEPEPPVRPLRAGPVTVDYVGGFLRRWRIGGHEILRMINFAVRDRNWGTVPFEVQAETVEQGPTSFRITIRAHFQGDGIRYVADVRFTGAADGSVEAVFDGHALADFERNRIGFTVLHPLEGLVGECIEVEHTDGSVESAPVPCQVSPHQPFRSLRALTWNVGGSRARLEFEGEVFETEDQRNWTDASFKTYGTPLELPYPVAVVAGDRVQQRLRFRLESPPVGPRPVLQSEEVTLELIDGRRPWPALGVERSRAGEPWPGPQAELLRTLQLAHYRCELDLTQPDWQRVLEAAPKEAEAIGAALELVIFLREAHEAQPLLAWLRHHQPRQLRLLLLGRDQRVTPAGLLAELVGPLRRACPGARLGAGTDAFFAEINRERVNPEAIDFLSYSINPQVHAFDRHSLVETFEGQAHTVASALALAAGADVAISPLTFKMRWNPNATAGGAASEDFDSRQLSLFGAGWALGSLASLAAAGAGAITCFEAVGPRGLMQSRNPRPVAGFPAPAGAVYPLYDIFREFAGAKTFTPVRASHRSQVSALVVSLGERDRLVAANHTPDPITLRLPEGFRPGSRRLIDLARARTLLSAPQHYTLATETWTGRSVELPPFAVVALDDDSPLPPS